MTLFDATLALYLDAAPWLLMGLLAAGLVKAWVPDGALARWLGGKGLGPILKAALIGAPLPLCSCGVLPAALALRRGGASKGATVSFLVATPETGPDSVAVSYALLGPFMAVIRPVAAIFSAVLAGLLAGAPREPEPPRPGFILAPLATAGASEALPRERPGLAKGMRYAFTDVLGDLAPWLLVGILAAGAMQALLPPLALAQWGTGFTGLVVMLLAGIPLYVCATASTPIAAGLLAAGASPGAALVFMLAGPATNLATVALVGRELGRRALAGYLGGVAAGALAAGLLTDALAARAGFDVPAQMAAVAEVVPEGLEQASGLILGLFLARPLLRKVAGGLLRGHAAD